MNKNSDILWGSFLKCHFITCSLYRIAYCTALLDLNRKRLDVKKTAKGKLKITLLHFHANSHNDQTHPSYPLNIHGKSLPVQPAEMQPQIMILPPQLISPCRLCFQGYVNYIFYYIVSKKRIQK